MYYYDDAIRYLSEELPGAGFAREGSTFFRGVGGSRVYVIPAHVDGDNAASFCEGMTAKFEAIAGTEGVRSTAFVFVLPDDDGSIGQGTVGVNTIASFYDRLSRMGFVVEIDIVDMRTGVIGRLGQLGPVDRSLFRVLENMARSSATGSY